MNEVEFETEVERTKKAIRIFRFFGWFFVSLGFIVFIIGLNYWVLKRDDFNEVGDFIGGVSGSLWALAGLFFIYIAFLGQKIEIKYQQADLKLNREELRESKEVFKAQANIMLDQKLDTTFFNLLDNHRKLVESFKRGKKSYLGKSVSFFNSGPSITEAVSGYEILQNIYSNLKGYFIAYTNFLNDRNIYFSELTITNPINEIISNPEIKLLYQEVSGIIEFISKKIRRENQEFYLKTLFNNLSLGEKFLLTAYNINCSDKQVNKLNFDDYLNYNFRDFSKEKKFIGQKFLYTREKNKDSENNFIVKLGDSNNYCQLDLYFINGDKEEVELVNTFTNLEEDIYLLDDLKKILDNKFLDFKSFINTNQSKEFMVLIRAIDNTIDCKVFDCLNVTVNHEIEYSHKFKFTSYNRSDVKIDTWIQDHFNNKENQQS